jgi:hypothetical protein
VVLDHFWFSTDKRPSTYFYIGLLHHYYFIGADRKLAPKLHQDLSTFGTETKVTKKEIIMFLLLLSLLDRACVLLI